MGVVVMVTPPGESMRIRGWRTHAYKTPLGAMPNLLALSLSLSLTLLRPYSADE